MPLPKESIQSYRERYLKMMELVLNGKATYLDPDDRVVPPFKEFVSGQLGANKCYTLSDLKTGEYQEWYRVTEVFGYQPERFTARAVNNDKLSLDHFILQEQSTHKIRYSTILFEILASDVSFIKRKDYYSVTFKMKNKGGQYVSVKRRSFIFEADLKEGILTRLDEWELMGKQEVSYVYPEFFMQDTEQMAKLNERLFFRNLEMLNIPLNTRLLQVLHLKLKGYPDTQIGLWLSTSESMIQTNFTDLTALINEGIQKNQKGQKEQQKDLKGLQQIRMAAKTWGLYPVPPSLLPIPRLPDASKLI